MENKDRLKTPSITQKAGHFITFAFLVYISGCLAMWVMSLILEKKSIFYKDPTGICFATKAFGQELADFYNIYNMPRWTYIALLEHYTFTTIFFSVVIISLVTWMSSAANKEPQIQAGADTAAQQPEELEEPMPGLAQLKKDFTDLILLDLEGNTKKDILFVLSRFARAKGLVSDDEALYKSFLEKEMSGTTAIGNGIALPEALYAKMNRPSAIILCRTKEGVDFDSFDGRPVRILLASLNRDKTDSLKLKPAISRILHFLRDEDYKDRIMRARTEKDIYRLWDENPSIKL